MPTLGIGLPALDVGSAFPQATPAAIFPPSGTLISNDLCSLFLIIVLV